MANTVKLTIKVEDDGSLSVVAKNAKKAAKETEELGKQTDAANKKRNRYNRTEKGVANLTSNSTKAFAKQSQTISGGLVPAYAVLASNIFALTALFGFLKNAADVKILEQSQVSYATNTGIALQSVTARLREASDGLLGFQQAGQAAAIGLAKGFSPAQLEDLAEGARKASTALGRDFQDSFDRLVRGASKAEPELLDELGITLRLADATQKYADAIGKNRDQLNDYERSQAVLIETQRQLEKNFGSVEAVTNPFVKLTKTLEDIVKVATQAVLPVFEGLAALINKSGGFAIAAFGLLALNIAKAAIPVDGIREKIQGIEEASKESLTAATREIEDFKNKIIAADKEMQEARAKSVQDSAKAILKEGGGQGAVLLERVAKGQELSPQQKGRLKKMLRDAEAQYELHGAVIKNTFKGVGIDMIRQLSAAMNTVEGKSTGFFKTLRLGFTRAKLEVNRLSVAISRGLTKAFMGATKAASKAGRAFNKALSFAGFIGIFTLVFEFLKKIYNSPYTILSGLGDAVDAILGFVSPALDAIARMFLRVKDTVVNSFNEAMHSTKSTINEILQSFLGGIDSIINSITSKLNTFISGLGKLVGKDFGQIDFTSTLGESAKLLDDTPPLVSKSAEEYKGLGETVTITGDALRSFAISQGLANFEMNATYAESSTNALKAYNEQLEKTKSDLDAIRVGLKDKSLVDQGIAAAKALGSLGVVSQIRKLQAKELVTDLTTGEEIERYIMREQDRETALKNLKTALQGIVDISPEFAEALSSNNLERLDELTTSALAATGGANALSEGLKTIRNDLKESLGGGDLRTAIDALTNLKETAEGSIAGFEGLGTAAAKAAGAEQLKKLQEALGKDINALEYRDNLIALQKAQDANALATENLFRFTGELNKARKTANEIAAVEISNEIIRANLLLKLEEPQKQQLKHQLAMNEAKLKALEIQRIENSQGKFAAAAQTPDYQGISDTLTGEGAFSDKIGALNDFVAPFAATMKSLGPEGEAMSVAITGLGLFAESASSTLETLNAIEGGASKSEKFAAGLSIAAGAVQALGSIQAAKTKAAIAGIDREIAAEKKRDGKSKESVAKIKALEAKKEAMKRKAFERDKKMQMAQAAMGTAAAIINAMQTQPFVPAGLAMAVIAGAMGAAQIAMIAGMSYQGGGGSPDAGAGRATSVALGKRSSSIDLARSTGARGELGYIRGESGVGGPENFKPTFTGRYRAEGGSAGLVVGEQGPELFVPEVPGRVIPNDDMEMGGTSNVTFNINTVDATGVEELLVSQRGNIIGMLREASNSYGKGFMEGVSTSVYTPESAGVRSY